ncbi:dephospho-CoA kinase [Enterococcus sp. 5H]|uniref:dephospho-CoA kinase n=1 Tax=Enterococcus sp. 5H TaxID=1229490 RepID=UPI0023030E29|nr:dephospho-CoA kinase [Enterococcus sp. 5H]MDA9470955.1 Dephospho-CoA kinase [Enterococcus sp. 5H]
MGMVLGLTGGIATGKSTGVAIFKKYGFPIVDADIIARQVVEPETEGLKAIQQAFGKEVIQANGSLDRKKLATIIFSNDKKRVMLNELLSPFIRHEIVRQIQEKSQLSNLVVVDIPLLYEGGYDQVVDKVAVVYIPKSVQQSRLMKRDNLTRLEAEKRIASQWSIEEKKAKADFVFDNQGNHEELEQQIVAWIENNQKNE